MWLIQDCGGMNVCVWPCLSLQRRMAQETWLYSRRLLSLSPPDKTAIWPRSKTTSPGILDSRRKHVKTLLCCSYAVRSPEPLTCHVSDGFPAVFLGFGNDRQEVTTPALQRFALYRVWGEESGAQRAQEPCAQNRPVSEGLMEWCVFLVSWCHTYRVIVGHSARLNAHFNQIVQPLGLPVAHAHTHGFSRSSVTRSCRNNNIRLEQTGWGKAFHTVEF